ncbi:glycoside hydrolase family 3 C-terminal domain-containing protein [Solirubrobacter sp. CPCC 204708]|uniref:Glycoside hydrolase family 3 C-terminal domain-containing protein n=1 Tax=Solirubrobacter deserti TaxID=2282478 RepID=A0ABT4RKH4_9ACTN|nr:glycoside hydrolase family 3 C-terminal domain-containing protein [Solirubrobacter deserti]MBE2317324.1 glycoside hydrolase family 3 C-terminal domain-containing protein [Solirubrobacter deserti]MDA0139053.1 glycoside hydrolase family 3 C-terminal domain-containing protein [Solirubrobacter deserti]
MDARLLTGADFWSLREAPELGLRRLVVSDGPAGVRGETWDERSPSANVPAPTALAATWDVARVERVARLLAFECRRKGVDVLLAPTVNLHRTPYGGRHFECFSEDPYLTAALGVAFVRGLQQEGVGATVKHFVANDSETERFTLDAHVDERVLRELYLLPFELIVAADPWAIMAAYNRVNGTTMTESPLIADVLRGEWGYAGVVMSDWGATRSADALVDLAMPGPDSPLDPPDVDVRVGRLVELARRTSKHEATPWSEAEIATELRAAAAAGFVLARNHGALLPLTGSSLRRVAVIGPNAREARTLGGGSATVYPTYAVSPLDGLRAALPHAEVTYAPGVKAHTRLPVAKVSVTLNGTEQRETGEFIWFGEPRTVELRTTITAEVAGEHVIGVSGAGRFTLTLDGEIAFDETLALGDDADPGELLFAPPQHGVPVRLAANQAVDVALRAEGVTSFQLNHDPPFPDTAMDDAVALARDADLVVLVVGTTAEVESEGFDRSSLALPGAQDELVARVTDANPKTVVVVNAGAPVLMPWIQQAPAVLLTWFAGQEAGNAIADVILGAAEPGGRLPTTWPATEEGLPRVQPVDGVLEYTEGLKVGYRGDAEPLFPFGHGLGYTSWQYLAMDGTRVRLANTGTRRGREVVQVYASRPDSAIERPSRWLAGFAVVEADAGEEVIVEVPLSPRAFDHWADGAWQREPGAFVLEAGRSVADLKLSSPWS